MEDYEEKSDDSDFSLCGSSCRVSGGSAGENAEDSGNVALVLGQGENCMRLEAEIPRVPETLGALVMGPDGSLDGEALKRFLEPEGETEDIAQRLLEEQEEEEQRQRERDQRLGEGDSMLEMADIGDGSYLALTDQNRRAILKGRTGCGSQGEVPSGGEEE